MTFWSWFFAVGVAINVFSTLVLIYDGIREAIRLHRLTKEGNDDH